MINLLLLASTLVIQINVVNTISSMSSGQQKSNFFVANQQTIVLESFQSLSSTAVLKTKTFVID